MQSMAKLSMALCVIDALAPGYEHVKSLPQVPSIGVGGPHLKTTANAIQPIMMPDPKDLRIAELEAEVKRLQHA